MARRKPDPVDEPTADEEAAAAAAEPAHRERVGDRIWENGRWWPYGSVPFYIDGLRVSLADYVAHGRQLRKAAALAELDAIPDDDVPQPDPPPDTATTKE